MTALTQMAGGRLSALRGAWHTLRVIRPKDSGPVRFSGVSRWVEDGAGLRCEEEGKMDQGGAVFEARRTTLWSDGTDGLHVRFADGRPFHTVAPGPCPAAQHDCAPDTYLLAYDFRAWPLWSVRWRVTGPRKDYRALTRYRPLEPGLSDP